jgi:hypothetical protein
VKQTADNNPIVVIPYVYWLDTGHQFMKVSAALGGTLLVDRQPVEGWGALIIKTDDTAVIYGSYEELDALLTVLREQLDDLREKAAE